VFKLEWFHRVRRYFSERLDPKKSVLWLGDLNAAPEPMSTIRIAGAIDPAGRDGVKAHRENCRGRGGR
jgi:exonuclease III